ncbi:MAG: hypothetical protein ACWGSQ_18575, partial [Longimicrobiales bacterium]
MPFQTVTDSVPELVREEFRAGRFWHGVRRYREVVGGEASETLENRFLLAEGEAGWGNWPVVEELVGPLLEEGDEASCAAWYLVGRAREEGGDPEGAEQAFTRCADAGAAGLGRVDLTEILLRRSRARWGTGDAAGALEDLRAVAQRDSGRSRWLGLELARVAAEAGFPQATMTFLAEVTPQEVRHRGWDLP